MQTMSEIALSISMLSLVAVLGLWLGNWRVYGVGLGIGGVLFGGIIVGHFAGLSGLKLDEQTLHFIQEFGLILFVYTIGIQVGPGFFSSCAVRPQAQWLRGPAGSAWLRWWRQPCTSCSMCRCR
jgi:uncharacterized transporter YbjL